MTEMKYQDSDTMEGADMKDFMSIRLPIHASHRLFVIIKFVPWP